MYAGRPLRPRRRTGEASDRDEAIARLAQKLFFQPIVTPPGNTPTVIDDERECA